MKCWGCDSCGHDWEVQLPFKRKKVKRFDEEMGNDAMVDALLFECGKCEEKIYVTKNMK